MATVNVEEEGYDLNVGGATGSIVSGTLQLSGDALIGTAIDLGGQLRAKATTNTSAIIAQAYAGTANAFEAWDSLGNVVASISNAGAAAFDGLTTFTGGTYRRIQIGDGTVGSGYDGIRFTDLYGSIWVGISAGFFRISRGLYDNSPMILAGSTAANGGSLHTSDATNLYGTGKFNSEVDVGVAFPAIHALMRGTPSGTERAIKVTSGPTYTTEVFTVDFNGSLATASFMQLVEMAAPAAPAANGVKIYAEDNGSGKTRLMARFATGSAVQIAIQP